MEKLQLELKDKEVENKIAGKKGDQLVGISLLIFCQLRTVFSRDTRNIANASNC